MSGTHEGGLKAAATNKIKYGEDFYKKMGQKGGVLSANGGFASKKVGRDGLTGPQRAALAGRKGGMTSRAGVFADPLSERRREVAKKLKEEKKIAIKEKKRRAEKIEVKFGGGEVHVL